MVMDLFILPQRTRVAVQSSPVQSRETGQKEKWKWLQTTVALGRTAPHIKHAIGEDLIQDLGADSCRNNNVIFFLRLVIFDFKYYIFLYYYGSVFGLSVRYPV
jgi:hypothetical protein